MKERDKFLTEAMGICFWLGHECEKCKGGLPRRVSAIDFSTHESFFILWKWCQTQHWWVEFINNWKDYNDILDLLYPDQLANAVYAFLKARENETSIVQR